ncbi:hypothetical protein [Halapricum desulfuricans]|uniref:Uncharacterized protein n=1 Tax=Halapricum desulfuricans TaxID=2841257 RepID=A0A897N0C5_9EURY|nr:hypothetical protein [Halapricum desulfuricans]QSG06382.1 hypothetical protein HSR121_2050 [Halapricum desulfuricans]
MKFPTATATVSTETQTETQTEPEPEEVSVYETLSEEIIEKLHEYDDVVETYRGVKKLALTHLFESPEGVTNADIVALKDRSPIAEHFVFFRDRKNELKSEFRDLRNNDEIPKEVSLPGFREEVEPNFEFEILSVETAEEWGVDPATFFEDEDEIRVPADYKPPMNDDGELLVFFEEEETEGGDFTLEEVLEIAEETDGIGPKKVEALKACLEAAL